MMCFNKECKGDDPHLARTCDVWKKQLRANSARILFNQPGVDMWDQDMDDILGKDRGDDPGDDDHYSD